MKIERLVNKSLNRQGYFWVVKLNTLAEAKDIKLQLGIGRGYVIQNAKSKYPFWVVVERHEYFGVEE